MEPGVEARRVPQRGQVSPRPDERLLDGVLGLIGVAKDEPGGGVQPEDRGSCKRCEGVMIASPRPFHELLLHIALGVGVIVRSRSVSMATPPPRTVPNPAATPRRPAARVAGRGTIDAPSRVPFGACPREDPGSRREVAACRPGL